MRLEYIDPAWIEHSYGSRFQGFQSLMQYRIRDVLLVSSLYDLYLFEEDGQLYELIRNEYQGLHLSHSPEITRVSGGKEALTRAKEDRRFDLVIMTLHIEDMSALRLAKLLREAGLTIPVVLLAYDNREFKDLLSHPDISVFNRIFIWQGDFRLIISVIKHLEDRMNVERDTRTVGVQSIILIEDNVRYYSSFLPLIYSEILTQSQRLISEGVNLAHRYLRMQARPKILLCGTFEEAWSYFEKYEENILGVISDIDFPRRGREDPQAGLAFARAVKERHADIPVLLQSTRELHEQEAHAIGASFVLKDSPTLLHELRQFMNQYFSFGDFIFRLPNGSEVDRATDLKSLEEKLQFVPEESLRYHGERNHFSNWLKARTEFWLAHRLRPRRVSDYPSIEALREDLIASLREYRKLQQQGLITEFTKEGFDPASGFSRIGGGSLGGKARGLGFVNVLVNNYNIRSRFEGTEIAVPPAVVLGTDVFDEFLDANNLRNFALRSRRDEEITRRFLAARRFPEDAMRDLSSFLELVRDPLAVRSSSLLEDSQYHPFAGVYETYMIPNRGSDPGVRLSQLIDTVKRVYASTFFQRAKDYIKVTSYRLEEERMAVIVQKLVGARHETRFYPHFAGVGRSHNFYPVAPQTAADGIVSVALGLGKTVVDGGNTVRFCPKYPAHLIQFFSPAEALKQSQTEFYALDLEGRPQPEAPTSDELVKRYGLVEAEMDGTLAAVGSTYSAEDDALRDGLSRPGLRVVTFAPILRQKLLPLAEILEVLLDIGTWGMGTAVEIEFAVNSEVPAGAPLQFGLLQMRPLVVNRESEELSNFDLPRDSILCSSGAVLGHGLIREIHDIVVVDPRSFDRSKTADIALEVTRINQELTEERRPYLLIGLGRWGTLDPWLGIPVRWDQISGARTIVETGMSDIHVAPSQGSHFFQNITSFSVGYFTVGPDRADSFIDWDWLSTQKDIGRCRYVRHFQFDREVEVRMNGHEGRGVIVKPGRSN
ncbi:MAG TPA: PEP/pyruvate-binding domain-containing protein [Bacteroidota bacterium]|nr:PEP/pyruvate-binding domain-containing protein [Bacteroidota bacterium]